MKDLALRIVQALADNPAKAGVHESEHNGHVTLRLDVAESDKAKIIGKQGKVIKAIRAVVGVVAAKAGKRSSVELD